MHKVYKGTFRGVGLLAVGLFSVHPQMAGAAGVQPGAGSILQQVQPKQAPEPSDTRTGLRIERPKEGTSASQVRFAVKHIEITGNTLFPTKLLHSLVAGGEGKKLTLGDLQRLSGKITDYYHTHGYSLSRAVIPAQQVKGGVVRFTVVEARFGRVKLNNQSRVTKGHLLQKTLSPLRSGQIIGDRALERSLLLLSDIPGVAVDARLRPGSAVGTSDLDVDAKGQSRFSGYLSADNHGNQYTGRARFGGGITIANPLRFGDELTLTGLTAGRGLDYGRAAYDSVINGYGTRLGGSYSLLHYILGGSLSNLSGYGRAKVAGLWARQPFIRSRQLNLYGKVEYNTQRLRDHLDATAIRTDRNLNGWTASLTGDARDGVLGGGINSWDLSWTGGNVTFKDATAQASDAATANTAGRFFKWDGTVTRLQALAAGTSLYVLASGQWTNDNLDSAEKLAVGGPNDVRAYDVGVLSADTGYRGTVELRHTFWYGVQAKLFYDGEHVTINRHPWTTGQNTATLQGAGIGIDWSGPQQLHVSGVIACPLGSTPELLGTRASVRGWVQLVKLF